jgi:cytochrome c-type biogenesis protein
VLESLAAQLGAESGSLTIVSFGLAFLGGLIAGFGPCVLPMIPAIFGYITGQIPEEACGSRREVTARSVTLTLAFIAGLALTSAAIGAAAAAVGHAILIGRWAYYVVAAIALVMGLQLLGVINLRFAGFNRFISRRPEMQGYPGAVLFGGVFGLIVTPCATPVLAVIATLAAASGDIPTGFGLLFVYGLGRGLPLLLVALFSGVVAAGMRAFSKATVWFSRAGGAALVALALYLVWTA